MKEKPHILILYCDQLQHSRLGFIDGVAYTPNIDRLANEGIHFTHTITEQGQCVPSRAVFMTGQSAHECGVMVNYGFRGPGGEHCEMITGENQTFAQVLAAQGYDTTYFGKGHLGSPIDELGFAQGQVNDAKWVDKQLAHELDISHVPHTLQREYIATDQAVSFLQDYEVGKEPLMFFFSTNLPHPPFFSEKKYVGKFPPEEMELSPSFYEETFSGKPEFQKEHVEDGHHGALDEKKMRQQLADYYSMIAMMDEQFGRIISEFERLGIWDDTLVIMVADHGDMMGAHKMQKKGVLPYDELYRVPLIIKLPKGMESKRKVIDDLISSQAIPGTILKLVGIDVPESFTGGEFTDAFTREQHPENEKVFFEHYLAYWGYHPFYGIRTRNTKYIRYYGEDNCEEMYDLENDPDELINVEDDPDYSTLKKQLADEADSWWKSTNGKSADYYETEAFRENRHNLI